MTQDTCQEIFVQSNEELLKFKNDYENQGWEVLTTDEPARFIKGMLAFRKIPNTIPDEEFVECCWKLYGDVNYDNHHCESLSEFVSLLKKFVNDDTFTLANIPKRLAIGFAVLDKDNKKSIHYTLRINKLKNENETENVNFVKNILQNKGHFI